MWNIVRWPRTCGYQPVMKEQRLGVHTGFWQKAWPKETASSRTSRSRTGVTDAGFPRWATASALNWSGLKMTICGLTPRASLST